MNECSSINQYGFPTEKFKSDRFSSLKHQAPRNFSFQFLYNLCWQMVLFCYTASTGVSRVCHRDMGKRYRYDNTSYEGANFSVHQHTRLKCCATPSLPAKNCSSTQLHVKTLPPEQPWKCPSIYWCFSQSDFMWWILLVLHESPWVPPHSRFPHRFPSAFADTVEMSNSDFWIYWLRVPHQWLPALPLQLLPDFQWSTLWTYAAINPQ